MSDLQTTTLLVGLAVALARAVEWLAKASLKRNGNGSKSAGLTAQEWRNEIRQAVKDMLFETAPKRHEDLEELMEKVLEREFRQRNEAIRLIIRDELRRQ